MHAHPTVRPRRRALIAGATASLLLGLVPMTSALAQQGDIALADHGIEAACSMTIRELQPFADIGSGTIHGEAVACVWAYGITSGDFIGGEQRFSPASTVTREQMASFIARLLDHITDDVYDLPPEGQQSYDDAGDISIAHRASVSRLTEAGILRGYGDGTFRPLHPVNREQMATYIATTIEAVIDAELPRGAAFDDVADTHQASIEKLAAAGIATGTGQGNFSPRDPIRRQQMASFLARTLDHLVAAEALEPLSFDPGGDAAMLGLTDIEVAAHDGYDRVTFTLEGDERLAGWRAAYVGEGYAAGSGNVVEVAGDAVLHLSILGLAIPGDLPQDVRDDLWDWPVQGAVDFDGEGIIQVVDGNLFEGQQEIFIGTPSRRSFTVQRLTDPQRIYVDVEHAS